MINNNSNNNEIELVFCMTTKAAIVKIGVGFSEFQINKRKSIQWLYIYSCKFSSKNTLKTASVFALDA